MRQATALENAASPFLKWAGGKTQLLDALEPHVPRFESYFEPFLGGGALFFHLASRKPAFKAHLSDLNSELINAYQVVKDDCDLLVAQLRRYESRYQKDPRSFYYSLRRCRPRTNVGRAARLIALNKTCYNGLYRVNSTGAFNVPMGRYKKPAICNEDQLRRASSALLAQKASLAAFDYAAALSEAGSGDFVYLDPPFIPLSTTSSFVSYTPGRFGRSDQEQLARLFRLLDSRGCRVLLSNSDTALARELYSEFETFTVSASRAISCKGAGRTGYSELLVRNYSP